MSRPIETYSAVPLPAADAGDFGGCAESFNRDIVGAYQRGEASAALPADAAVARSLLPPGTAALRDFSYIAPEIPVFNADRCVGCMACVTECPDTAILAKAIPASRVAERLTAIADKDERFHAAAHWTVTRKYHELPLKHGRESALFGVFIDPTKCKGCGECAAICDALDFHALEMVKKDETTVPRYEKEFAFFRSVGSTPKEYINERALADFMLDETAALLYTGGSGSCMGCGEGTAIRMMLAAGGFAYGPEKLAIVAATGCNTVCAST
ncbi:MAG TPA: 4Fe-4S binding protein, partial [Candidatus Binatia bacterium]|nr:4Fe-4S binding protein [Candidatus Binatia bacterium]